jgi:superfamily II DNA or RNA helicase
VLTRWNEGLWLWGERLEPAPAEARPLRGYQQDALDLVRDAIAAGERRIVLQLPTGGGKTRIAAELISGMVEDGVRVLFVVPRLSLIEQSVKAFHGEGLADVGVIQGKHFRTNSAARVQVASVQTLGRRELPEGVGLVLIDECHLQYKMLQKLMRAPEWSDVPFVGLSATPWSRGLGKHFSTLLRAVSTRDLIEQGHLVPLKIFCPPGPDLSAVRTTAGDFNEADLARAVDRVELVGNVVETWLAKGENRQTLLFAVDCAHAQHLQERFVEAGVSAAYVDASVEQFDREDIFEQFRRGDVRLICSVATLDTGIDLPIASCLIDARPTKSAMKFVQTIGRGLRTAPEKINCILLDHASNARRLGVPIDIDFAGLDMGKGGKAAKRKDAAAIVEAIFCPECHVQLPVPRPRVCPECQKVFWAVSDVVERAGELVELGCTDRPKKPAEASQETKWLWEGTLRRIGRERGHKSGWAANQYREKFGHYPSRWNPAPECEATVEIRNWVKSRAIAYAKSKARASRG